LAATIQTAKLNLNHGNFRPAIEASVNVEPSDDGADVKRAVVFTPADFHFAGFYTASES